VQGLFQFSETAGSRWDQNFGGKEHGKCIYLVSRRGQDPEGCTLRMGIRPTHRRQSTAAKWWS